MIKQASRFSVQPAWKVLFADMGINLGDVLTLAGLPQDLFASDSNSLSVDEYFSLWHALEKLVGVVEMPLLVGKSVSVEAFDPPIFACFCSADMNTALERLSQFKRLIGPMVLTVDVDKRSTTATVECYGYTKPLPLAMAATELVFFTQLIRLATRESIKPAKVVVNQLAGDAVALEDFFGCTVTLGKSCQITFKAEDAARPFLTENMAMWSYFEPGLRQKLSELDAQATTAQKVKSVLLEMLPSGHSSIEQAASRLAQSKRTIQRKLSSEGESYQGILQATRAELARHYLINSTMSTAEISFLLGFGDPNSFSRAFTGWTGKTPGQFANT